MNVSGFACHPTSAHLTRVRAQTSFMSCAQDDDGPRSNAGAGQHAGVLRPLAWPEGQ
jgi:hypothetical protein